MKIPVAANPHTPLDLRGDQIRLFELRPANQGTNAEGSFKIVHLSNCPQYTALSYTWGDQAVQRELWTGHGNSTTVGQNLWQFLRVQASTIKRPKLLWIDAICINQSRLQERNHQIALMKDIYAKAARVFVWLGESTDESDMAMDYVSRQAFMKRASKKPDDHLYWPPRIVKALQKLCERRYWQRMWIIQELIHANRIAVWCGEKHFNWIKFEALYHKIKTLEDNGWSPRHVSYMKFLQSSATTMVWQRAHFRHHRTPIPSLRALIETFREWQCTDVRDKVFALLGLTKKGSHFVCDYAMTPKQLYFAVMKAVDGADSRFGNLLSQLLGLGRKDIEFDNENLKEYKPHPSEKLVLRARSTDIRETQYQTRKNHE